MDLGDGWRKAALAEGLGVLYVWAGGDPRATWPNAGDGVDCSGFAQMALVRLGFLSPDAPDRPAHGLYERAAVVQRGELQVGDLVFYKNAAGRVTHVDLVYDTEGPGYIVIGAIGGGRNTDGDDPAAAVQLKRGTYRRASCFGRLRGGALDTLRAALVPAARAKGAAKVAEVLVRFGVHPQLAGTLKAQWEATL